MKDLYAVELYDPLNDVWYQENMPTEDFNQAYQRTLELQKNGNRAKVKRILEFEETTCPHCGYKWIANVIDIPVGTKYEVTCAKCGTVLIKKRVERP